MSSASTLPLPASEPPLIRLDPRILLGIYLIVPATLLFLLLDAAVTGLEFSRRISFDAHLLLLVSLLLQSPHAFASMFTFADREYASAYRFTLLKCVLVAVATIALILAVGDTVFMICLMLYNFYHQNSQQAGIAAMVARSKTRLHNLWRWMAIIIESAGFLALLIRVTPEIHVAPGAKLVYSLIAMVFMVAFAIVSGRVAQQSKTGIGKLLIGAHAVMLFVYVGIFLLNLPLMMIIAPVVVHDLTAFAFYINHNANRNRDTKHNVFSKIRNIAPMPEILLTPLVSLAVILVLFLSGSTDTFGYAVAAIVINVVHIYAEGVIWKAGSLHRRYTRV